MPTLRLAVLLVQAHWLQCMVCKLEPKCLFSVLQDEFEDICTEHNVKAHVAEVERLTLAAAAPKPTA